MSPRILFSEDQLCDVLRAECERAGGQSFWAKINGFTPAFVSDVLRGRRDMSERMAERLGYKRETVFRKISR